MKQPVNVLRSILVGFILTIVVAWRLLMGDVPSALSSFDLGSTEVLKFVTSSGQVEASDETVERLLQPGLGGSPSPKRLIAFEENKFFVYASLNLSAAESPRKPDSPRLTRRLIHLKPSTLVVEDEVEAGSPESSAEWLLHSRMQPSISGRFASLVEDDYELTCETLIPETAARQVKRQQGVGHVLQLVPKEPSRRIRFLHVLHARRRGDEGSVAKAVLSPKGDPFRLTVEASQRTYKLILPPANTGAGEIEVSRNDSKMLLERRFFPSGVLPHGREGVKLLELWDGSYRGGKRPFWDAGRPSSELRRVVEEGVIRPGSAVDLGCGSGTDAIYLASKGFNVTGIDIAPTALSQARDKAERAGVRVRWLLANVLSLPELGSFDFIFDRGCYHDVRFDNAAGYVETVRTLSRPERTRFLLLAGNPNEAPVQYAPPQVAEEDLRSDFSSLFEFEWLRETRFETSNPAARGPLAWSAMMRRKARP